MTGPADDGELCVKMLNSGAPGVMLDLEDSCVNEWSHHETGIANILACLRGELTYFDKKRNRTAAIQPSKTVIFTRPRGLHISQAGLSPGELASASLYDVARVFYGIEPSELKHPLCIYIPSPSARQKRCGGVICSRHWQSGAARRTTTSSAWPWSNRTRRVPDWKSSPTT